MIRTVPADIIINTDLADWDGYEAEDCDCYDPHGPVLRILGTAVHLIAIEVTRNTDDEGMITTLAVDTHFQPVIDVMEDLTDSPTELAVFNGKLYFIYGAPTPL